LSPNFAWSPLKWLLPRHFRRQEARRCTRRYDSRVCEARCPNITHRRRSSLSKTREATLVCARGRLYAAGKPGAHALAASTAAPRAGLTYASSLTRPSLSPMSAKDLRLPRERIYDADADSEHDADAGTQTDDPRRPSRSSRRRARASRTTPLSSTSPPTRARATRPSTPTARTTSSRPTRRPRRRSTSTRSSRRPPTRRRPTPTSATSSSRRRTTLTRPTTRRRPTPTTLLYRSWRTRRPWPRR
jgi:hypothetical protein